MDRTLSLAAQEFIRVCERMNAFNSNHGGLPEADCEAVLFHALDLIRNVQRSCALSHGHDPFNREAA